ncbi:CHAD domain-containing protein [Tepidimonas taiwanensis]|uniref:CYTH and CHAD domain-containing protein n=3 Tax=Tepidimonas taiwanensis TaxID=307486 RepID=UPI00163DCE77|nr:CYTH and CHAD domain-containing protein [Tepidimonas taiwanensis]MCX7693299.1 CHAD domain-containing protein [Tepidimonas taiwanensis]UBQ04415.1 CHAD domain-containing protein [Tepidimonas taiwanensis]
MPQEIELKFALPGLRAAQALARLRTHPLLRRRRARQQRLVNRYYDTPDGWLREQRCALRVRAITPLAAPASADGARATALWEQTLKTAGTQTGAWSARGEWTVPLNRPRLDRRALLATPLGEHPEAAQRLASLQAVYETRCVRTTWVVHAPDGVVEVALDAGTVRAGGRHAPLLELELELLRGDPAALDRVADALAQSLPLLPARLSKAQRAQQLLDGTWDQPVHAQRLALPRHADPMAVARAALGDALGQVCDNLALAVRGDDPEYVHQARVGWRRWRSLLRLLRPWLPEPPAREPLQPLLDALGAVRDLDVAATETLPAWAAAFVGSPPDATRERTWQRAQRRLQAAARRERRALRARLGDPAVGQALLAHGRWLLALPERIDAPADWAAQRLARWHARLRQRLHPDAAGDAADALHAARLLAKRLRYGAEAVASTLAPKAARRLDRWQRNARAWQTRIGSWRDMERAAELLLQLHADPRLAAYLRGVAAAIRHAESSAARA